LKAKSEVEAQRVARKEYKRVAKKKGEGRWSKRVL
jgi:hypothetical protein